MTRSPGNPSEPLRFITDHNLGKLAKWLRLLGYDTLFYEGKTNKDLWNRAFEEKRIVLTRKKNLRYYPEKVKTVLVVPETLEAQLTELFTILALKPKEETFLKLCSICNHVLQQVEKKEVLDLVPSYILESQNQFYLCSVCEKVYWRGSHAAQIIKTLRQRNLKDLP